MSLSCSLFSVLFFICRIVLISFFFFFFSSRRRHTRCSRDWSSDVCSSDLNAARSVLPSAAITGQKELAVMAALGRTERAAFLSRVLGYERLRDAQERVREVRNSVAAEVRGLEAGLPDGAVLAAERQGAEQRLAGARTGARKADAARRSAEHALGREEPRWNEWIARRERTLSLDGERRMAEQAVVAARQEFQRLDKELADALAAGEQLRQLGAQLEPVARLKREVAALERLQLEAAARRADE